MARSRQWPRWWNAPRLVTLAQDGKAARVRAAPFGSARASLRHLQTRARGHARSPRERTQPRSAVVRPQLRGAHEPAEPATGRANPRVLPSRRARSWRRLQSRLPDEQVECVETCPTSARGSRRPCGLATTSAMRARLASLIQGLSPGSRKDSQSNRPSVARQLSASCMNSSRRHTVREPQTTPQPSQLQRGASVAT